MGDEEALLEKAVALSASVPERSMNLIRHIHSAEPRNRMEQLEHEYQRILLWNSTLSNALVTLFLKQQISKFCHARMLLSGIHFANI